VRGPPRPLNGLTLFGSGNAVWRVHRQVGPVHLAKQAVCDLYLSNRLPVMHVYGVQEGGQAGGGRGVENRPDLLMVTRIPARR
jgi:hypothetical protein